MNVLIIEDSQSYAKILAEIMGRAGIVVCCVSSVEEAMLEVAQLQPHIILLDVNLTTTQGEETLKKIPDLHALAPDAEVVAMSGFSPDMMKENAEKYGASFTPKMEMDSEKKILKMLLHTIQNSKNSMEENIKLIENALGEKLSR